LRKRNGEATGFIPVNLIKRKNLRSSVTAVSLGIVIVRGQVGDVMHLEYEFAEKESVKR
jgi:hypothetical protein